MRALLVLPALLLAACQLDPASAADPASDAETVANAAEAATVPVQAVVGPDAPTVTVYKSPTCGCCSMWVEHLEASGFEVEAIDRTDMGTVKDSLGVPRDLGSCHTAVVDGYVVEGHVPAEQIARLLEERPEAKGLSVPGMPVGSPGMEMGDRRDTYDVLILGEDGEAAIYQRIPGNTAP